MILFYSLKMWNKLKALGNTQHINGQHINIKFTTEIEIGNSLSLRDIKIVRKYGRIVLPVYGKYAFCGFFAHYKNFIPNSFIFF